MQLVVIYGPVASGKLTVARQIAEQTGIPLFHNHLIVDAVAAVFPFGSTDFRRLREQFWLDVIGTAARAGQSIIFTFAPEPTVSVDFQDQLSQIVTSAGGEICYFALTLDEAEQERRLTATDRAAFGKLRSIEILRALRTDMVTSIAQMPTPILQIDTGTIEASESAAMIIKEIHDRRRAMG